MAAGSFRPYRYRPDYKVPAVDSARARAAATLFLVGVRSLDLVTPEKLVSQHRLKRKTAEFLLEKERARRANGV